MTPEKANQIAAEFICEGMQYGDPVPALAKIILSASKVQAGHVRLDDGREIRYTDLDTGSIINARQRESAQAASGQEGKG